MLETQKYAAQYRILQAKYHSFLINQSNFSGLDPQYAEAQGRT